MAAPDSTCYTALSSVDGGLSGELVQSPLMKEEFSGTDLPANWLVHPWVVGGNAWMSGGQLIADGAMAYVDATGYAPGRSLEFEGTFQGAADQHIGFLKPPGDDLDNWQDFAIFSTRGSTSQLYARSMKGGSEFYTGLGGGWLGEAHRYLIVWGSGQVDYYIDGQHVAGHNVNVPTDPMTVVVSDANVGILSLDWLRMSPYETTCTFTSRVFDTGRIVDWFDLLWSGDLPSGTSVAFETRTGDNLTPDAGWSAWNAINSPIASPSDRYIQYRLTMSSADEDRTPVVSAVSMTYDELQDPTAVALSSFSALPLSGSIQVAWQTLIEIDLLGFNLYRSNTLQGEKVRLNLELIPSQALGGLSGASYAFVDASVQPGESYYYWLEVEEIAGAWFLDIPELATADHMIFLPVVAGSR
jgi:hypothetical protein